MSGLSYLSYALLMFLVFLIPLFLRSTNILEMLPRNLIWPRAILDWLRQAWLQWMMPMESPVSKDDDNSPVRPLHRQSGKLEGALSNGKDPYWNELLRWGKGSGGSQDSVTRLTRTMSCPNLFTHRFEVPRVSTVFYPVTREDSFADDRLRYEWYRDMTFAGISDADLPPGRRGTFHMAADGYFFHQGRILCFSCGALVPNHFDDCNRHAENIPCHQRPSLPPLPIPEDLQGMKLTLRVRAPATQRLSTQATSDQSEQAAVHDNSAQRDLASSEGACAGTQYDGQQPIVTGLTSLSTTYSVRTARPRFSPAPGSEELSGYPPYIKSADMQGADRQGDGGRNCRYCRQKPADGQSFRCGHVIACLDCAARLQACELCQSSSRQQF